MREIRSPLDGILSPFATRAAVDAYAVQGLSPLLVADFTTPYYRKAGSTSTFDSTFTHSRAGNATMVDSDGLIKWAPHNLITYSEDLNGSGWVGSNITIDSSDTFSGDPGTSAKILFKTHTFVANVYYKIVFEAKEGSHRYLQFLLGGTGAPGFVNFDLNTGNYNATTGTATTELVSDGFYKCTFEFSTAATPVAIDWALVDSLTAVRGESTASTGNVQLSKIQLHRSDLGGMVNNPDRGDSYVPTTSAAVHQARRNHYTYNGTSWVNSGLLLETEARENLLYGTNTLATQTYTTTAVPHTLSFTGTGTVTLSGSSTAGPLVGTGTGENNRVNLTFTPTAASLTLTVTGTVTNAQLEIGSTPSSYMPNPGGVGTTATRPTESLQIAAADMPWDASNVSLQMQGKMTYADEGAEAQNTFARWYDDASNYITIDLDTDSTDTGEVNFEQQDGTGGTGTVTADTYSPGILVPYNIASRNTSTAINGATDGTAGTEDTTPTALPDLSAKDFDLGYDYMGTIAQFRAWNVDVGDTGIEDATS